MRRFYEKGEMAKERRGGDRKSQKFEEKRKAVQTFIESFKAEESHYCRTDVCSTCLLLDENIKKETNAEIKNKLIIEKRVHRLRFKAFYEILREQRSDLLTMSFDCQKNLGLPKVPDQSAYYSRQYNFYNFTIVVGSSKAKLTKDNIFSYVWNETSHNKGNNAIISAVHHFLTNLEFKEEIKVLRIVADGCSGQNKNTGMLAMLGKWLTIEAARHVKKVEIIFPVVGHSFIPPDRIFAQIEKDLKKREVISSPEQYQEIITQYCKLTPLDTIAVQDWKSAYAPIIKPTTSWHLQFQKCKRPLQKKSITMVIPDVIPANQIIPNKAKVTDVSNLLKKHYGEQWKDIETLAFYKTIEARRSEQEDLEEISEISNDLCENGFDDVNLIV
ncbi:hypothetical protein EVAR_80089_1 [Eumeta japonica]|uniref:DUF7869 domain-containing protein n=1 Tax=Eumeta variegata TaxID=151549 RepID=A0A4C1UE58_EUMVA|nr:hypothetical protein EVAR_80089_1 [Eumeta japonica]